MLQHELEALHPRPLLVVGRRRPQGRDRAAHSRRHVRPHQVKEVDRGRVDPQQPAMERQQAADAPEAEGNHHAYQNVVRVCATVRRQRVRARCAVCWWSGDALTWVFPSIV